MKITVHGLRAIETAETDDARIIQILGGNMQGKTALLNGVGAALIGKSDIYGATKNKLGSVVRYGKGNASVLLEFPEGGELGMSWPGDPLMQHPVPKSNEITAGFVDPCADYDRKQWATFVRSIAGGKGKLTMGVLKEKLGALPGATRTRVEEVARGALKSWEAEQASCDKEALNWRREWQGIAGEAFGSSKAEAWTAEGFVEGDNPLMLEEEANKLEEILNAKIANEKFAGKSVKDLRSKIAKLERTAKEQRHILDTNEKLIAIDEEKLAKFPENPPQCCPHCQGELHVIGGVIHAAKEGAYDAKLIEKLKNELDGLYGKQRTAKDVLEAAEYEIRASKRMIEDIEKLATSDDERGVDDLKSTLAHFSRRSAAAVATSKGRVAYQAWSFYTGASGLLKPTGLRLEMTKKAIPELQKRVDAIADYLFPGEQVEFVVADDGVDVMFNGLTYQSLTWNGDPNSYKLRIKYLCQFLQQQVMDPTTPVILDRADTLERNHLLGVMRYLRESKTVAVIARTVPEKPDIDRLKMASVGRTYWLEGGKLEAV